MHLTTGGCFLLVALAFFASPACCFAQEGAKNLFYRQISRPAEKLNTGVQYWIELNRGGKTSSVNNKFDFRCGDRIKFHVKANIDGYAYVILQEGSQGEHAVLFPDPRLKDDNKVKAGVDYCLPSEGYLLFDSHPGSEKLLLVVSRKPVNPEEYLKNNSQKGRILVASRQPGAKDLVPGSAVISFEDSTLADLPEGRQTIASTSTSPAGGGAAGGIILAESRPALAAGTSNCLTTVVEKNPDEVLALDIVLSHRP